MVDKPVHPDLAPPWLKTLIAGIDSAEHSEYVRRLMSSRAPQKDSSDEAAVLMVLTGAAQAQSRPEDAQILLTHRTPTMRSHSGQMAFPGGGIDEGDLGPVDAALREAWEETGLHPERVTVLATLQTVTTGGSNRAVRPVVAYSADPGEPYAASVHETDDVFFAPISHLLEPANRLQVGMLGWSGPAFNINGYLVWGFTGMLLDAVFHAAGWNSTWNSEVIPLRDALKNSRNNERHS